MSMKIRQNGGAKPSKYRPLIAMRKVNAREIAALASNTCGLDSHELDEMAVPTYVHSNPLIRWVFWVRHKRLLELAGFDGSQSVLDFGTGTGALLPSLCGLAAEVHATDLRDQIARKLASTRKLPVCFHDSGSLDSSLDDDSLDVIVAADVLEHIESPLLPSLLELFSRKLRERGRLLISAPTENFMYRVGRLLAGYGGKGHYHVVAARELARVLSVSPFRLESHRAVPCPGPFRLFTVTAYTVE